ncbi:hypothetical protein [Streptomyces macrosporus]|uniref:Helix-turn-helix domain-containing protein n=1 Tax=Streptomyces macrosporus TaxID=44032 RepID=A0ABP5WMP4_9ACTN
MAIANPSAAARPHAHPMAAPGYGKRSAPDQLPRRRGDFDHLPPREASIAAYLDRLPDGAAIDVKTLARELPDHGQQAVRSALNALSEAGHLRRFRETVGEGRTQWVYRTYFSRTARDDAWWAALHRDGVPPTAEPEAEPGNEPRETASGKTASARPRRSEAYEVLASLGRVDARMTLSAAECAALEASAAVWLARGANGEQIVRALTAGLPETVHCPAALARRRLTDKLPPEPSRPSHAPRTGVRRVMECTGCGRPGRPEALPGGLCRVCRGVPSPPPAGLPAADVRARVQRLRAAARTPAAAAG